MTTTYPIKIDSSYGEEVIVYTTMTPTPSNPPSSDPNAYLPVYTKLGTVAASGKGDFTTDEPLSRVVIARSSDEFPIKLAVVQAFEPSSETIKLAASDETTAEAGWTFYKNFSSQPYSPVSLQFADLVENTDPSKLIDQAATFFNDNSAPGLSFGLFSAIGYWATNKLFAFPGTYYCYEPPQGSSMGFVLPTTSVGTVTIADGKASYTPTGGGETALNFASSALNSSGASKTSGIALTAIIRDLAWEGKPDEIVWGFVGTNDGTQFIAQNYEDPKLPWYAVTYDLVYGAFFIVQLAMAVDAAISLGSAIVGGVKALAQKLSGAIKDGLNETGDSASTDAGVGDDVDPVNVDVDIDIDIDIDVDVDIDIDIDVDVDVDIDIDIDVDFIAVVDVDVDVDIDVDIDVVTDTDTDTDIDIDVDVDTDVDVEPGGISQLLNKVGSWIMEKALPTLIEGAAMYLAFNTAGKLLQAWKSADEKDIAALQPRQTTGLGLLINYMLQSKVAIAERWDTFADYAGTSKAPTATLQLNISTILSTGNDTADNAESAWKWSTADQAAAVAAMSAAADAEAAFQALGKYTFDSKPLPLKVGCSVAMDYLKAQS